MSRCAPVIAFAASLLMAAAAHAGDLHWMTSWAASAEAPLPASLGFPPPPALGGKTIRQVVRISGGGQEVRIRFTNAFGDGPLRIGAAHLAFAGPDGAIRPGSDHALTFGGRPSAVVPSGAPLLSDPVRMPVKALTSLAVSLYLPGAAPVCTCHATSVQTAYVLPGDATGAAAMAGAEKVQGRALISAVEVASARPGRTIVAFGNSITDGVGSSMDANRRWPDQLAERLVRQSGPALYVANEGISGNRLLNDGFGVSALARFDRDVLAQPGLAYVIVFEGINDIGLSRAPRGGAGPLSGFIKTYGGAPVSAEDIIDGYRQLIARARAHGVRIYGATITPYEGAATYSAEGEAERQAVNRWIRTSGAFDAVLDFDKAIRDPAHPGRIRDGWHMGDHLHGSDAGYRAIAASIDLKLFK